MILKTRGHYHAGYVWIDGIVKVQDYGFILSEDDEPQHFATLPELVTAIEKHWGKDRGFTDEVWPLWPGADGPNGLPGTAGPIAARTIVARRADDEAVLVIACNANPVFLLSDKGDTIDRL